MDRKALFRSYNASCRVIAMGFRRESLLGPQSLSPRWGMQCETICHWKIIGLWQRGWYFTGLPCGLSKENPFFQDKPEDTNLSVTPAQGDSSHVFNICLRTITSGPSVWRVQWGCTQGVCERVQWPHESWGAKLGLPHCFSVARGPFFVYWHRLPLCGGLSRNPWSLSEQSFCQLIIITLYLFISLK